MTILHQIFIQQDLAEQLADAEEEARRAAEAEEEARQMLQESRRLAREEREAKRKAEIEKKKLEREKQREARKKMVSVLWDVIWFEGWGGGGRRDRKHRSYRDVASLGDLLRRIKGGRKTL